MWVSLLEWCARSLGATRRTDRVGLGFYVAALSLAVLIPIARARYGFSLWMPVPALAFLFVSGSAARHVISAREALWRAVCLGLDDPRQRPDRPESPALVPPTGRALHNLAEALDAARRGAPGRAAELVTRINRSLLRPEEARLFDATRALIALELGDRAVAAQLALKALPTGSGDLDARLGRAAVTEAWRSPARLAAVDRALRALGLGVDLETPLSRMAALVHLRVAPEDAMTLPSGDVRRLGDEARALGEDGFAAEIEARTRASMYR